MRSAEYYRRMLRRKKYLEEMERKMRPVQEGEYLDGYFGNRWEIETKEYGLDDDKLYIIAGDYNEYIGYVLKNNIPVDKSVYVNSPDVLRGREIINYEFCGTYYNRSDIERIIDALNSALIFRSDDEKLKEDTMKVKEKAEFESLWNDEFNDILSE